ncbi:MAG: DUF4124 domain-containing protein [Burkholderiales bacterium]
MRVLLHCAILAGAIAAAAPLYADTYKWIDDEGVTNYSDARPFAQAAKAQVIKDRVSVVAADPSLGSAIAEFHAWAARHAELAEADWLQRQRIMLAAQTGYPAASCPNGADCGSTFYPYASFYYPYYASVFVVGAARHFPRVFRQRPSIFAHDRGAMRSGRGSLR